MPSLQLAAARILQAVVDDGRSLDRSLDAALDQLPDERTPRLRELAYGGCRYYALLDGLLGQLLKRPVRDKDRLVHFLMVVGLYQLEFLRTPDHAAVDKTVSALNASRQSWARGLVNGVLREYIRRRDHGGITALKQALSDAGRASFTDYLFDAIYESWPNEASLICDASIARPPMTLRVNCQKTSRDACLDMLASHDISAAATTHSALGITLDQPLAVTALPKFAEGWMSVQDEAAQLCTGLLALAPEQSVLDGCAAPGGKSCAILEAEPTVHLTAVDLPDRVATIEENLARLGLEADVQQTGLFEHEAWSDGRRWARILLDVPCSGSGVIRRHPDILHRRADGDLEQFADQQLALLEASWGLLESGGRLLYVTCSVMTIENDGVIARFIESATDAKIATIESVEGIATRHGVQRLPGVHPGDGFYYCALEKH